jgi:hypothetical protein
MEHGWQAKKGMLPRARPAKRWELVIPNSKLKLVDRSSEGYRSKGDRNMRDSQHNAWH